MISHKTYTFRIWLLFFAFVLLYASIAWITNSFILTDSFYYSMWGSQLSEDRLTAAIDMHHQYQWVIYLIQPLTLLLKWLILSGTIFTGLFLLNKQVAFKNCFKIIMLAEFVPLTAELAKVFCFLLNKPETIQDIQTFYPLSLTQLLNAKQLPVYLVYPLQQFNLFEVAYWLLIAAGISVHINKPLGDGIKVTASSYGIALSVWVLCVVFMQLQFS